MYCILIAGIPASGKSTAAEALSKRRSLPSFSKDRIKECLYDTVGFRSRGEKEALGLASMRILYETVERLMRCGQPFILENNFENTSRDPLMKLLERYSCIGITVLLTGDFPTLYRRFLRRNADPSRHRGHVVNDSYPEKPGGRQEIPLSCEDFVKGVTERGMNSFSANGPCLTVDTTDFSTVSYDAIAGRIRAIQKEGSND